MIGIHAYMRRAAARMIGGGIYLSTVYDWSCDSFLYTYRHIQYIYTIIAVACMPQLTTGDIHMHIEAAASLIILNYTTSVDTDCCSFKLKQN